MTHHILKERIGLPVWDGDFIVGTKTLNPGDSLTKADLEEARQDKDQQAELIEYNCLSADELKAAEEAS